MGFTSSTLKAIKLAIFENIYTRRIRIDLDNALFSFSFDDVPLSAATTGASILEQVGTTGTYYVAMGIPPDQANQKDEFIGKDTILALVERGHHIGCHTYSHLNLRNNPSESVLADCEKNIKILENILDHDEIDHFAYPFGAVSPGGKKALRNKYKTMRTSDHGINTGITDLTHLRAVSLYTNRFDKDQIKTSVDEAVRNNGWLIFYSHDIVDNPTDYGTKPEDLRWVVEQCMNTNGEIVNVKQAFERIILNT